MGWETLFWKSQEGWTEAELEALWRLGKKM